MKQALSNLLRSYNSRLEANVARIVDVTFSDSQVLPTVCRAAIFLAPSGFQVAIQELDENNGRSVTNSWPALADTFLALHMERVDFHRVTWFEVYPYYFASGDENVCRVFPKGTHRRFEYEQDPSVRRRIWQALGLSDIKKSAR
jgi:hypothetical protein